MSEDEVAAELRDGMTIGVGGWGSRRKPMSLIRAIARSPVTGLTVVSYGGPDVGLLCRAGKDPVAGPPLDLDVALVHMNRSDAGGNAQYLGVDPYFDDLFCMAATRRFMSVEQVLPTDELAAQGPVQTLRINRLMVDGVV